MTQPYQIHNSQGTVIAAVHPLESMGVGNESTPREIVDIIFNHPTFGCDVVVIPGDSTARFLEGTVFDIVGSAYAGQYVVSDSNGQNNPGVAVSQFINGLTYIPVSAGIHTAEFNIVGVTTGVNGKFFIEGAPNAKAIFLPGLTFDVTGNSTSAANASYTILSTETPELIDVVAVDRTAHTITVQGDNVRFFTAGAKFVLAGTTASAGDGEYEIVSAVLTNGDTVVTYNPAVKDLPVGVAINSLTHVAFRNPLALVTVASIIPGATADGTIVMSAPEVLQFAAPTTISTTATPKVFDVVYNVAGDWTATLPVDTPILIKGAQLGADTVTYQARVVSTTFLSPTGAYPSGLTQVATKYMHVAPQTPALVTGTNARMLFPVTAVPFGHIVYSLKQTTSPVDIVGRGAPMFSPTKTWGHAMQENMVRLAENFNNTLPPAGMIEGQLWFDNATPQLRLLVEGASAIIDVNPAGKTFSFDMAQTSFTGKVGGKLYVSNNAAYPSPHAFTINAIAEQTTPATTSGKTTLVTVTESVDISASNPLPLNGGPSYGHAYTDATLSGVVVTNMPAIGDVLMGGHQIKGLADPSTGTDALNLQFADGRYVNVTGDTMTGALTMNNAGINVAGGTVTLSSTGNIVFDGTTTAGISLQGTGNIAIGQGNLTVPLGSVTVGSGTNKVVLSVNGSSSTSLAFTTTSATSPTGNPVIDLGNNKIVNSTTPTAPADVATKQYVDDRVNGIIWISPILDPNLFDDSLSTPPVVAAGDTLTTYHRTYLVKGTGTGAWAGLNGHAVYYDGTTWKSVLGRAVAVGDRFGVFIEPDDDDTLSTPPAGGLAGQAGKIATVTSVSPFAYSFYTPTEPDAVSVKGTATGSSVHMGHSYTFRGTWGTGSYGTGYRWIEFSGPQMLVDGSGLRYTGNILNVGAGTGISVAADAVALDTTYADGRYVTKAASSTLSANVNITFSGTGEVLGLPATPTTGGSATSKTYVDAQILAKKALTISAKSADYTLVLADANTTIYHDNTDNNPRTFTIPANASVAYPVGTWVEFDNDTASAVTIAITTDTLVQVGTGSTGSRTIAANGKAKAVKVGTTRWRIDGVGLS